MRPSTDWSILLIRAGEPFAAGYMRDPAAPPVVRMACGLAEQLRHCALPPYDGARLYPVATGDCPGWSLYAGDAAVRWHYSACLTYDRARLLRRLETADHSVRRALEAVDEALSSYPTAGGFTHSIPNYDRVLAEGLGGYRERILRARAAPVAADEPERAALYEALLVLLEGIKALCRRLRERVAAYRPDDAHCAENRERLLRAFTQIPFSPARSFAEAVIATNLILQLDGPDNLGRLDQFLWPYYAADRDSERTTVAEGGAWIGALWEAMDCADAWNVAIGGTGSDGAPAINELTGLCIEAGRGRRRPNLALRIPNGMPDRLWDTVLDNLAAGGGLPALYNEAGYRRALRAAHLDLPEADLAGFAFGGCTETMIHGCSNVGSLEGDLNLPLVLTRTLERLPQLSCYDALWAAVADDLRAYIRQSVERWNANQETKARWQPQPIRSLLVDDCIENGREYAAGGARYNWCVVNVMGLANVADSLAAVRFLVYDSGRASAAELLDALRADFVGHERLRRALRAAPKFGNDDPYVDEIAEAVARLVFGELALYAPWRGGRYLPSCLMFTTYAEYGKPVGATPDGRRAGEPLADSAGAYQGRDRSGPTALLRSVARIPHEMAAGTLVVNIRVGRAMLTDPESRRKLRSLIESYFAMGGMQLQVNVMDQETLRDALEHPERYGDLVIRVGGYSEYWTRLDEDLRRSVLERVEHG